MGGGSGAAEGGVVDLYVVVSGGLRLASL